MALSVGNRHSAGGNAAVCRPPGHGAAGWPGVAPEEHGLSSHSRHRPGCVALELYFSVCGPRAALRGACSVFSVQSPTRRSRAGGHAYPRIQLPRPGVKSMCTVKRTNYDVKYPSPDALSTSRLYRLP